MVYADTSPPDILLRKKLDAVEKVKQAFGDMVIALLKEKTDEIKYKDFCVKEFHKPSLRLRVGYMRRVIFSPILKIL